MEKLSVYFAGSIRGGREFEQVYRSMIACIEERAVVPTRHVGDLSLRPLEQKENNCGEIYREDIRMLEACDLVIAECTQPSLGVGYELAYAEKLGKPCYVFYQPSKCKLSAMIAGDPYFHVAAYETVDELLPALDAILDGAGKE